MNAADLIRVLLIEDNDSDAFLVRAALDGRNLGFEVSRVEMLHEAQAALVDFHAFDMIIGDLNLPDSSPENTLEFLLQVHEHLPVVVLNACDDPDLTNKCARSGLVCYSKQKLLDKEFIETLRANRTLFRVEPTK
jgi:DNA-binding NarL/FixJ family response regulator